MHRVEEEVESLPPVEYPQEPQSTAGKVIQATPWWSISTGVHVVTALLLGFFWVVQAADQEEAVVVAPPRKPRIQPEMEKPRDLIPNPKVLDHKTAVEDPVYKKDAVEAERNETDDQEEFKAAKGDSMDFVSDKPFKGKGSYDVIGGGGGGGGRYGGRLGGKQNLVARGGGGGDTEDAVLAALKWLSRHQAADGSWKTQGYIGECKKIAKYSNGGNCSPNPGHDDFDTGNTALSLLAFLGAGYSHLSKDVHDGICFGDVVRKGMQWMMAHQDPEGCIGPRSVQKYMYNHTIAALAMSEAYGLTGSNLFKDQAQKAVDFTIAAQNPGKGWRYSAKCGDNDTSVTGWAAMVLKSAELSALAVPSSGYEGTRNWLNEVTEAAYGRAGYTFAGSGKVFIPGVTEHFNHHESLTAIAIMARIFMDKSKADPRMSAGVELLLRDKPKFEGNDIDYYYWYYASLALFQYDGPNGPKWKAWNEPMKEALVKNQNTGPSGCKNGSWETAERWSCEGGRVYGTAINALTLEVYYRYVNVLGGGRN